jgi:hypothetical protein
MLVAVRLGDDPEITAMFDFEYADAWAESLGEEVQQFWHNLKEITEADVQ